MSPKPLTFEDMRQIMPTTDECFRKATRYERLAEMTDSKDARDIFLVAAASWRRRGALPLSTSAEATAVQAEVRLTRKRSPGSPTDTRKS